MRDAVAVEGADRFELGLGWLLDGMKAAVRRRTRQP
jgi:hypothetical protein